MVGYLLEIGLPHFMINKQDSGDNAEHFIEQIDFGHGVLRFSGVFDEQGDQPDVGIERVEAFGPDKRGRVVGLGQGAIAKVYTHLGGHAKEPCDEVVGLEDAVLVHQLHEDHERLQTEERQCELIQKITAFIIGSLPTWRLSLPAFRSWYAVTHSRSRNSVFSRRPGGSSNSRA